MKVILLSGGSGKRLWPLSNDVRSKQFLPLFKDKNGNYKSMIQNMVSGIKKVDNNAQIIAATSKSQVSSIINQIGDEILFSIEPFRKDTFPAICLAYLYLHDKCNVDVNEPIVVCPVDLFVDDEFFKQLLVINDHAIGHDGLFIMGVKPTYTSSKYGYILPEGNDEISRVKKYVEKPSEELANKLIENGALWNAGIFVFKGAYLLRKINELIKYNNYNDLLNNFDKLDNISFDYAVVEKEKNTKVLRFNGKWMDLGTWNTLSEALNDSTIGNVVMSNSQNTNVINNLNIPVVVMGIDNAVVVSSRDGILVSDKHESSYLKPIVDKLDNMVMYADKSWGTYDVLDYDDNQITIKVILKKGHQMNYHSHQHRDEVWTIIKGKGRVIIDGVVKEVNAGDVVNILANQKHTIYAVEDLEVVEVQIGIDIDVEDKIKYDNPIE